MPPGSIREDCRVLWVGDSSVIADGCPQKKLNKYNARVHASASGGPPAMASNTPLNFIFFKFSGCLCSGGAAESLSGMQRSHYMGYSGGAGEPIYFPGGLRPSVQSHFALVNKKS